MNFKKIFLLQILLMAGISQANDYVDFQPLDSVSSAWNYFKIMFLGREWRMGNITSEKIDTIVRSTTIIKNSVLIVAALGTYGIYKSLKAKEKIQALKTKLEWAKFLGSTAVTLWSIFAFLRGHQVEESLELAKYGVEKLFNQHK